MSKSSLGKEAGEEIIGRGNHRAKESWEHKIALFLVFPSFLNYKKLFKEVLMKCICHLLRWMAGVQLSITGNGRIKLGNNSPQHLLQLALA